MLTSVKAARVRKPLRWGSLEVRQILISPPPPQRQLPALPAGCSLSTTPLVVQTSKNKSLKTQSPKFNSVMFSKMKNEVAMFSKIMLNKCVYLCRQGNTRPQECRSSHSPALRTLPWSRRRSHHGTDRASTGPCGTPLPQKTPSHYGCTSERLGRRTKKKNQQMLSSLN